MINIILKLQRGVYILRYNNWETNDYKIGQSKNIHERLKSYKTSNGSLPDFVMVLQCNSHAKKEGYYHKKFKSFLKKNSREHFNLSRVVLLDLLNDGFTLLYGTCDINVKSDAELVQKEYDCNVLLLQKKLQEKLLLIEMLNKQQLHTNIKIDLDAYFISRTVEIKSELPAVDVPTSDTMSLKEKLKKQKNIKDNVVLPTQTDIINKALYDFLKTDTEYKKDAVIFIETFHKIISDKLNLQIKKLNNNIFKEVNKEYIV